MKLFYLLAALALPAGAQALKKTACSVVTQKDAEELLGPKAMQHVGPGSCAWNLAGSPLVFVVIVDSSPAVKQQILLPRQNVPKMGGTIQEEPGVFPGAYSATGKGAQTIYLLKGDTASSITITNDGKGMMSDMLPKLRPIAKRIAGRL